jgi:chromate transporter
MILLTLFLVFTKISLFAIGGAYTFLPLLEKELVQRYQWMGKEEFLDVLGMAKVFPGAISIKYASYTGYKIAGLPGAIVANIGNVLGPLAFIIIASSLYAKYRNQPSVRGAFNMVQLAVFALIIALAFQLINLNQLIQFRSLIVILISLLLFIYTKVHPAAIIIGAGVLGAFLK